jgi:hypothetical protein
MPHPRSETSVGGGVGLREENLHVGSGLRVETMSPLVGSLLNGISLIALPLGGGGGAAVTTWQQTGFSGRLVWPSTPVVYQSAAPAVNKRARVRVHGIDQFGVPISETSPWVTHGAVLITRCYPLSKVFAEVTQLEWQSEGYDAATDLISLGTENTFDPINSGDNTVAPLTARDWIHEENLGLGTTIRVSPYGDEDPVIGRVMGYNWTQGVGASIERFRPATDPSPVAGFVVGHSEPGFEGCAHKLGFQSPDAWVTKIQRFGGGEFRMGGQVESALAPPAGSGRSADILEFHATLRSSLGSRNDSNAETSYVFG